MTRDYEEVEKSHVKKEKCPPNNRIVIALQIIGISGF